MFTWGLTILNNKDTYSMIEQVYNDLLVEKEKLNIVVTQNKDYIKEIDLYIQSVFEKEDIDYEVFSPRNAQSVYKDQIDSQNKQKEKYINSNIELNSKISVLNHRLELLSNAMDSLNNDNIIEKDNSICDINEKSFGDISCFILDLQEKERKRIARDLHDNSVQNLTHLIHKIELSSKFIDQDTIRAKMELMDVSRNIKSIINDMRDIIFNLRPMEFDDIGLKETFEKFLEEVKFQSGINIEYDIDNIETENELKNISMFHMVRECVNNSLKYANAKNIIVSIKNIDNKNINILIKDDGIGFDTNKEIDKHHFGLSLMKESIQILRGKFEISSELNKGTVIQIRIPYCIMEGVSND